MATILLLSLGGAVIAVAVSTLWYSNATPMGRIHMRFLGFDVLSAEEKKRKMEEVKPKMMKMYAAQLVLSFLMAFAVVFVVTESVHNGVPFAMAVAFPVMSWLCFMVPAIGSAILWSDCDRKIAWKKFFSDSLSHLVTILLIALMTGFFL